MCKAVENIAVKEIREGRIEVKKRFLNNGILTLGKLRNRFDFWRVNNDL